jgi:hypothetical protein
VTGVSFLLPLTTPRATVKYYSLPPHRGGRLLKLKLFSDRWSAGQSGIGHPPGAHGQILITVGCMWFSLVGCPACLKFTHTIAITLGSKSHWTYDHLLLYHLRLGGGYSKVIVTSQPTVSQPVCPGVRPPPGTYNQWEDGSIIYLYNCFWAFPAQLLEGPSPAELVTIFYSLIWDSINLVGQVPVFVSPRNRVAQWYSRALASLSCCCQSQSYRTSNSQSASLSWFQATIWNLRTIFFPFHGNYLQIFVIYFSMGRPLLQEDGSVIYAYRLPSPVHLVYNNSMMDQMETIALPITALITKPYPSND